MSGPAADVATGVMIECLEALGPARRPLIVGEPSGRLAAAIRDAGGVPTLWLRQASEGAPQAARAWPPDGSYDAALIRLPKAKEALDFALHASAAHLAADAPIAVFGANAEGIRSVAGRLGEVAAGVETRSIRHHARVVVGLRRGQIDGLKPRLVDWRGVREIEIDGARRRWISYPGTFAKGGLDLGTAQLLGHLPPVGREARILDFAAGTGVIAAALSARAPGAVIDMIEADAVAIEAARENVPVARAIVGASLRAAGDARYDLIVSNPPLHDGIAESRSVLDRLIADAPRHLRPAGRLVLVVQRRVPVLAALAKDLANPRILADDGSFTVAMAERATPERRSS